MKPQDPATRRKDALGTGAGEEGGGAGNGLMRFWNLEIWEYFIYVYVNQCYHFQGRCYQISPLESGSREVICVQSSLGPDGLPLPRRAIPQHFSTLCKFSCALL